MIDNSIVQKKYHNHTYHLKRDTLHLGDAENISNILEIVSVIKPNVYMLAECCVDRTPTLQLATYRIVRRMRLGLISQNDRLKLIKILEKKDIEYRRTSFLALNSDFSETIKCKFQKHFVFLYEIF